MSPRFLLANAAAIRGSILAGRQVLARRTIAASSRPQHKESSSQNPDHQVDKHKLDSLKKQKDGQGHWKPELASDSEEAVKADRSSGSHESVEEHVKGLQERTKNAAEQSSKSGTSGSDGL